MRSSRPEIVVRRFFFGKFGKYFRDCIKYRVKNFRIYRLIKYQRYNNLIEAFAELQRCSLCTFSDASKSFGQPSDSRMSN